MNTPSETQDPGPSNDITLTATQGSRELRAVHSCEALKRNGQPCGRYVATIFVPPYPGAAAQWLCPQHKPRRPKPEAAPGTPAAPKPPVAALKEPRDAIRLASWAAIQGSLGRISPQQGTQITTACREFRLAFAAEAHNAAEVALVAAWELAQACQDAGDREGLKAARADMRRLFAELGIPAKDYERPSPDPDPRVISRTGALDEQDL